ncbi:condensation domain-containing protein [Pedobacter sp. AW1-32]|uniref:condensation domain-containing protein n=1 Tax=Pedobacter sp. AW1-32 TaxID=3383026 RepID=UPI003FED6E27
MKRRLILGERIMHVDSKTPLNCVFTAKISGKIDEEKLRLALSKIQQKHPLLRMKIDNSGKEPYFVHNENIASIPLRIIPRHDEQDWLTESKKEWYALFDRENEPLARLIWIKGHAYSELLLVLPHCICDGTSILNLMRELMSLMDNPQQELHPYSSFNSVQDLLPANFDNGRAAHFKGKVFSALAKLYFFFKNTKAKNAPENNYVIHWKLNPFETHQFITRCKQENTSVHAAICAAFLLAFKTVQKEKSHGKVISPVDIRRFIPSIKQDTLFAFAPIAEMNLNPKLINFWDHARALKTDLDKKISEMKIFSLLNMSEYFHSSVNRMIGFLKSTNGSHDITLSNMGRLDIQETYQDFKIETIYSPTVAFPWRNANTLVLSSFNNQLDFSFLSNASFLPEAQAKEITQKACALMTLLNVSNTVVYA